MTIVVDDKLVSATTEWISFQNDKFGFNTIMVTVPGGVTADYTIEALNIRKSEDFTADDLVTFSGKENLIVTSVTSITGSYSFFRIRIDTLSGGTLKVSYSKQGAKLPTDDEVG